MFKILTIFSFIICSSFNLFASETTGVVTTIQPINSLVSAVIGNTGKTISLIPAEVSPHEYILKPSDTKKLQKANIIFAFCNFFVSEGFNLYSCGDTSVGINEIVLPVFPITALTKEFIG